MRGAHSGGKSQPGKRLEFLIDEKSGEAAGRILKVGKWRIAAAIVEDRAELLVILLVEGVDAALKIILAEVYVETRLASGVVRAAILRGRDGNIQGRAFVLRGVVVVERRERHQRVRIEGVHPGKIHQRVRFAVGVAKADAGILRREIIFGDRSVFDVIGKRIVGNLIVVFAK